MTHEELGSVSLAGETLSLRVVSDDHPDCALAAKLWTDVYAREFAYVSTTDERATHAALCAPTGALLILATVGDECVATLRMAYQSASAGARDEEFEFAQHPPTSERLGALSRLVVARRFRKTALALHMLDRCHRYNRASGNDQRYDRIVVSCKRELLHYYFAFGFELARPDAVAHPALVGPTFIVACSRSRNERVSAEIARALRGHLPSRVRLGVRYHLHKWALRLRALHERSAEDDAVAA
jgi:predicted GNAT family N-acyltransferase